jgi:DNA-nicking Smr family endonuclease
MAAKNNSARLQRGQAPELPQNDDRDAELEDAELFRAAVGNVLPVTKTDKVVLRAEPKPPLPLQHQRDETRALAESLSTDSGAAATEDKGDTSTFLRPGLSRQVLRRLRSGHWVAKHELDLHGYTTPEAKQRMVEFLALALRQGVRCVRIIHGKGLRNLNEREPVLKNKVRLWLSQREDVLAYAEARPADGGGGAVIVLLRAPKTNNEPDE